MIIPKAITVGRTLFKVAQPAHIQGGARGDVNYTYGEIRIAYFDINGERTARQRAETFWHETTHAILRDMGSHLAHSEKFVTEFSVRLNKVVHSAALPK